MVLTALAATVSIAISAQQAPVVYQAQKPIRVERPHTFGVGGSLAVSSQGGAGGFRYFFTDRIGTNLTVGWSNGGPSSYGGGSSTWIMPSLIYMITKPNFTREMDLRPYAGFGFHFVHGSNVSTAPGTSGPRNDWGVQAYGGAELSFKSVKNFTLSVDVIYYNITTAADVASKHSGTDWAVSAHFYLK